MAPGRIGARARDRDRSDPTGELESRVPSKRAATTLRARSRLFDVRGSRGDESRARVITIFEPETQLFWWTYEWCREDEREDHIEDFGRRFTIITSETEMLALEMLAVPPSIWYRRSTEKVESLEAGEALALRAIEQMVQDGNGLPLARLQSISLHGKLPPAFFFQPHHPMPPLEARIHTVDSTADGWVISILGREERAAEVELDSSMALRSVREVVH